MNLTNLIRQIAPHAVMAVALCTGAWMMLIEPRLESLAHYEEQLSDNTEIQFSPAQVYQLGEHVKEITRWVQRIIALNELSQDSSMLFATIMEIGEEHGVEIPSLQPAAPQSSRAAGRSASSRRQQEDDVLSMTRLELAAVGTFENIASFLDALSSVSPLIRPHSLTLSPADDGPPPKVLARLSCDVITVNVPSLMMQMKGAEDVD